MAINIEGGIISLRDNQEVRGNVISMDFPYAHRVNGQVPLRAEGAVILDNPPHQENFEKGAVLVYKDSVVDKNMYLRVVKVEASSKYEIMRED